MVKPYQDQFLNSNTRIRTFELDQITEDDLVWHQDHHDRTIKILEGVGWKFQYDNQLPIELNKHDVLHIPAEQFHRLIAGNTDLIIEIIEKT